ncbi:hypothetical protein P4O66_000212 [Electrophorus voltai]|uniref:USP domain-containing protein n=1 Tax=Electrophorus voltai TaxID=2609070 RepID=A0AAD8ZJH6_9TELE|nr:hypothetical protein P4O66_000212 [Electrophorus voltai]
MVMLTLFRRATLSSGDETEQTVAMNGEGAVVGQRSPALAGYSGECLFPLVSRPLEDVRASLSSAPHVKGSRKKPSQDDCEDFHPSPKRSKHAESDAVSEVKAGLSGFDVGDSPMSADLFEEKLFANGHNGQRVVVNGEERARTEVSTATTGYPELSGNDQVEDYVSSTQEDVGETMLLDGATPEQMEMVPTRPHLFWRNRYNLCWLDSLLVALVHFRAFSEAPCEYVSLPDNFSSRDSTVVNLYGRYKNICAYLKTKEQQCQDSAVLVPVSVLQKAERELAAFQLSLFRLLKPKLQCKLGEQETPVFALPSLLQTDDWARSVFQHTAAWEFTCTSCGYALNTCVEKTVTTFTQLVSDWHPLNAVHRAQCNNCHRKNQRRKLVFQKVSSVLTLHFVEGLPRKDVSRYSFDFQGTHYDITTIIQYDRKIEHFVTWILQPDGSWLEFDDLKYPHAITHKRFTLPAKEFHLVFWEAKSRKEDQLLDPVLEKDTPTVDTNNEGDHCQDFANSVPNDTCIVDALTVSEDSDKPLTRLDMSIGNTTLLDTFDGLSHDDIVTLTLVEVKVDAERNPQGSVERPAESTVTGTTAIPEKTSICQVPCTSEPKKSGSLETSSTPAATELILPSVAKPTAPATVEPLQAAGVPSNPTLSSMSYLYQQHPSHRSTPSRTPLHASPPKPDPSAEGGDVLPAKPAGLFGGFRAKNSLTPVLPRGELRHPLTKAPGPHPAAPLSQKPLYLDHTGGSAAAVRVPETWADKTALPPSAAKLALCPTDALRLKLMKKLKAKKKKLARLNQLLGKAEGVAPPRPDSTDLTSLYSVTSSTSAHSPAYDRFFAELLSPATTASNLSPDSTGLLEVLTSGQGGATAENSPGENPEAATANLSAFVLPEATLDNPSSTNDDFLDELISGSGVQQSTIENPDFNALDMFF